MLQRKLQKGTESHIHPVFLRKSLIKFISDFCIKLVSLHHQTSHCMVNIEQLFGGVHVSAKALFKNIVLLVGLFYHSKHMVWFLGNRSVNRIVNRIARVFANRQQINNWGFVLPCVLICLILSLVDYTDKPRPRTTRYQAEEAPAMTQSRSSTSAHDRDQDNRRPFMKYNGSIRRVP